MTYADVYDRCLSDRLGDLEIIREFLASVSRPGARVLEIGAGAGRIASRIDVPTLDLLENDPDMVARLRSALSDAGRPHRILPSARFRLPLASRSMDGVFLTANTLGEMMPVGFALAEIARVSRDGGRFHFLNENPRDLETRRPYFTRPVPGYPGDLYRITTRKIDYLGRHSHETILEYCGQAIERRFGIFQILPDFNSIEKFLKVTGFKIVSGNSDLGRKLPASDDGQFFNYICQASHGGRDSMVRFSGLDRFYSAMATEYDAVVERGQYRVPNRVTELLSDAKDRSFRVLDLGCANGHLGRVLASRGFRWKFFGVDFNDEMVWKCRESEVYESVLRCDLNEGVPVLEDEYFDIVLGAGITEFVESGEHFVADVARVLNRGGKALLTFEETAPDSLPWGEIQANGVVKFHYPEERILELFKRSGLAVESLERFDAYFSPTLRRWIPYVVVLARKP